MRDRRIYDLDVDGDYLAVGTNGNLYYKIGTTPLQTIFQEPDGLPIYSVLFEGDTLWFGTIYGLYMYQFSTEKLTTFDTPGMGLSTSLGASTPIYELYRYKHYVWMVSNQGFARYDLKNNEWATFTAPVAPLTPRGLVVNEHGAWVGTEQGLRVLNPQNGVWALYTMSDGLASNLITAVTATPGYIWAGTDKGLTRIAMKGVRLP